jgi:hypothetical protein
MANRMFQQFHWSLIKMLTSIVGSVSLVQEVKATRVTQGVTLTAVTFGTSGNLISIAFTGGGTAGAEVVTVTGNAISVQIESGVSSVTQVRTAINASGAAAALVVATGTNAATVSTAAALFLTGGIDGVASYSIPGVSSVVQSGVGQFTITLSDSYPSLVACNFTLLKSSAQDLVPQIKSIDVTNAKTVVVSLLTGATPTDPTAACTLFMDLQVKNTNVLY